MKKNIIFIACFIFFNVLTSVNANNIENTESVENEDYLIETREVENNDEYAVVETDFIYNTNIKTEENSKFRNWYGYSIGNIKKTGSAYTDKNVLISSDDIVAGTSFTFKFTYSRKTVLSGAIEIDAGDFNSKKGYANEEKITMSKTYTYSAPTTYNGKAVKYVTVTFCPKLQKYTFSKYFLNAWAADGTAVALTGFTMETKIYYK